MQADGQERRAAAGRRHHARRVASCRRSYWSFANDELGDYDRFGYGGPTDTPSHTITAFLTDPTTGELTDTPVDDCGAQSQLPQKLWYDPATD